MYFTPSFPWANTLDIADSVMPNASTNWRYALCQVFRPDPLCPV